MENRLLVFISSMIGELLEERDMVRKAINTIPLTIGWAFEVAPASAEPLEESYLSKVRECDIFVLLIAEDISDPIKKEYQTAIAEGKRRLVFLKDGVQRSPEAESFINQINVKWDGFSDEKELCSKVQQAIKEEIVERYRQSSTSQPVSPKASDLRLLIADPSGQSVSHLEFSIPPRVPNRNLAWEVMFRLYLDNQGSIMARYVVIEMFVTSDTDFFLAYDYDKDPLIIEESPRPWQITNKYDYCYFEGGVDFVCHSEDRQHLGLVKMLVPRGQQDTTMTFDYRILAEGYKSRGSFAIALKPESLEGSSDGHIY